MKRQNKRLVNKQAQLRVSSVGNSGAGEAKKADEGQGILGFLPSAWRHDWLPGLLLVAVTVLAYQPVWHAGFIWDDSDFVTNNPVIKSANGLYRMWFTASTPDYFPMTSSILWLEWHL